MESKLEVYILFPSHSDGLALEKVLKSNQVKYTIIPTPRVLSKCCGVSIRVNLEDIPLVIDLLADNPSISIEGIHPMKRRKSTLFNI